MESFTIKGDANFITLSFDEVYDFPHTTCYWGGYDTRMVVEIKSGSFQVKSAFNSSTGEIYTFFKQLKECNNEVRGTARYDSYEGNLTLITSYDYMGHVNIRGEFSDSLGLNKLQFEFQTDQSFIKYTLDELELIVSKYGDMRGAKK